MKNLLILLISLTLSGLTVAQTNWTSVNSGLLSGQGVGQLSIGMDDNTGIWGHAVAADGSIVDRWTRSQDGGATWTSGTFNAGTGLSQLFAIDGGTCWAVMNTGATQGVYKTTDGGTTWVRKPAAFTAGSFADVLHFFNDNDGVVMGDPLGGYYEIYTTSDGGESWTRVPTGNIPAPSSSGEYGITGNYCASGDHIWFGTNEGRIFHSIDKGLHWTAALTAFGNAEVVAPLFADATHGIAYRSYLNLGIETNLNITTDGGATWTDLPVLGDMYARYFAYVPGTTGTYVGSSSADGANGICYSYDGGTTWYTISSGYNFTASAWLNDSTGWAGSIAAATGGMYIYTGPPLAPAVAPVANFQADHTAIALNGTVNFTDLSIGPPTSWAWTFPGGTPGTSTLQNPSIMYGTSGTYNVTLKVTNANGNNTKTLSNYIYVGGVGINDKEMATVTVFPNPVKDVLNIQGTVNIQEVDIMNLVGQVVFSQKPGVTSMTVNTSDLKTGVYSIRIKIADGYVYKKIVVN